jgi:hypothetical protein
MQGRTLMAGQSAAPTPALESVAQVERALEGLWASARRTGETGEHHVAARSSVLNLVVLAPHRETAERCVAAIAATAGHHPSRSLVISETDPEGRPGLQAWIETLAVPVPSGRVDAGAETVHITVHGETGRHLASIIMPLLVHDLPVALWWPDDPPLTSHRADRLLSIADRLIVDGSSWSGDGLDRLAAMAAQAADRGLVVADFSLLRQARWREALASVYDRPDLRPHLRAVQSITVRYSAVEADDARGLTNVVRPVYHAAWLASRLGMTVAEPFVRHPDGRREARLRQGDHPVCIGLVPVTSDLGSGSTVRVEIASQTHGMRLVGDVTAGDLTVDVVIREDDHERVRRSYLAPRLNDVDLLGQAIEEGAPDPIALQTLAMARRLVALEHKPNRERRP